MIVIIDNYDSFTYNLVDLVKRFARVKVFRNDQITPEEILSLNPKGVLISPGPGRSKDGLVSYDFIQKHPFEISVLGVCLGHQIIGEVFGATLGHADYPMHGKTSRISHDGSGLFADLPNPVEVMRYHSLVLKKENFPDSLAITAWTQKGEIMAFRHKTAPLFGVQFHPESILSQGGERLIRNWTQSLFGT